MPHLYMCKLDFQAAIHGVPFAKSKDLQEACAVTVTDALYKHFNNGRVDVRIKRYIKPIAFHFQGIQTLSWQCEVYAEVFEDLPIFNALSFSIKGFGSISVSCRKKCSSGAYPYEYKREGYQRHEIQRFRLNLLKQGYAIPAVKEITFFPM